jgi:hypothetical protein
MTIGKKLYLNFGAVLAMVVVLFLINLIAVQREHSAKAAASQALQMAATTDKIRFQMMQNRLSLSNYLLSGDTREVDRLNDGIRLLEEKLQAGQSLGSGSFGVVLPLHGDQVDQEQHHDHRKHGAEVHVEFLAIVIAVPPLVCVPAPRAGLGG